MTNYIWKFRLQNDCHFVSGLNVLMMWVKLWATICIYKTVSGLAADFVALVAGESIDESPAILSIGFHIRQAG